MKIPDGFVGLTLLERSSQIRIGISTTFFSLQKVLICAWLQHSIKSQCCMRLLPMAKFHPATLCCRTRRRIHWKFGRMHERQRGNFGNREVRICACRMMLECSAQATWSSLRNSLPAKLVCYLHQLCKQLF